VIALAAHNRVEINFVKLMREGTPTVQKKILVVDDSDDTREMMAKLLELEAFKVVTAEDGHAGLSAAEAEQPDLIITDINMPNLNGIEMIKMLRNRSEFKDVPIMAITAYGHAVAAEALQAGADHASTKPIEFELLIGGIKELLLKRNNSVVNGF
jgi:CheY-like chemotaxis protein